MKLLILTLTLFVGATSFAQVVRRTTSENFADAVVYVTSSENFADCNIYLTTGASSKWVMFTSSPNFADKTVHIVTSPNFASPESCLDKN